MYLIRLVRGMGSGYCPLFRSGSHPPRHRLHSRDLKSKAKKAPNIPWMVGGLILVLCFLNSVTYSDRSGTHSRTPLEVCPGKSGPKSWYRLQHWPGNRYRLSLLRIIQLCSFSATHESEGRLLPPLTLAGASFLSMPHH